MSSEVRWTARPGAARAVTLTALLVPVAVGTAAGWWVGARMRDTSGTDLDGPPLFLVAFFVIIATIVVVSATRMLMRPLIPFAALLQLDLPFPGQPPSRFRVALKSGSTRRLQQVVHERPETDEADAAATILAFAAALSRHDRATRGHSERVRALADLLGEALGLDDDERDRLRWSALLHDVGKLGVHAHVLNKMEPLDDDEWRSIEQHPIEGARLAEPLRPFLGDWVTSIEHHHERWDGSGYPHGIEGEAIALGARIVAVADVYEVMTSPARNYRRQVTPLEAQQELGKVAGTQLDPTIVRTFLTINEKDLRRALNVTALLLQLPQLLRWRTPLRVGTPTTADPVEALGGQPSTPTTSGGSLHSRHPDASLPKHTSGPDTGDDVDLDDAAGLDR